MFEKQNKRYYEKFLKYCDQLRVQHIETKFNLDDFKANNDNFKKVAGDFAVKFASGINCCVGYSALCAVCAEACGLDYKLYAGFCLKPNFANKDEEIRRFNQRKAEGVVHPGISTHTYLECNGNCYEFFSGDFDSIKLDCELLNA